MGGINETRFNLFFRSGNNSEEDFSGTNALPEIFVSLGEFEEITSDNSDPSKGNIFFERGNYRRISLFGGNRQTNENNAVGGENRVSADSSPAELLRDPRVRAMLDVLGYAEGTGSNYGRVVFGTVLGPSDRNAPYDRSFVGRRNVVVDDLRRHPNLAVRWANGQPPSSAAGRYQFLYRTWRGLDMPDFSPRSQDLGAVKLMQRRGMIEPLLRGDFTGAIRRGAPEWASLPVAGGGSYYGGQGARNLADLQRIYSNALSHYQGTAPPPATPSPTQPQTGSRVIAREQRGAAVEDLQDKLIRLGLMTAAQKQTGVGVFGPRTEAAVKKFQKAVGLSESGLFDGATRRAMNEIFSADIKKGARGETVRALQQNLVRLGYLNLSEMRTGPGIFGPYTDAALRRFQREHDLTSDGIFGPKTFRAVQNAAPRSVNQPSAPVEGRVHEYRRWNVYSTGERPARLADGYEDLQTHHDYQSVDYVMRGLTLRRRLEAQDVVLTRPGQSNFGQSVPSPLAGRVLYAGDEGDGYGNKVVIKNSRTGQIVMLGHLQSLSVRRGETVFYGQNLGEQGSSGTSTGAHIHINADRSVIRRWVADLADGKFDGRRERFDIGRRP